MTAMEIIAHLAEDRAVEKTIQNICHRSSLTYDLQDLSQMIYVILMEYDPVTITGLWERKEIGNFIVAIIKKQLYSRNSPYYYEIIKPGEADEPDERTARTED